MAPCKIALLAAAFACACGHAPESAYLSTSTGSEARKRARDMDPDDLGQGSSSLSPGDMRLAERVCQQEDLTPAHGPLGPDTLVTFLRERGCEVSVTRARKDLSYLDIRLREGTRVRLRVATTASADKAARHLHEALLEHGMGSWGVRRSNLAVLAPIADIDEMVDVAVDTGLACWGVLTVADRDDVFVVPGGYAEL